MKIRHYIILIIIAVAIVLIYFLFFHRFESDILLENAKLEKHEICRLGVVEIEQASPSLKTNSVIIKHSGFHLSYDTLIKHINWAYYILTKEMVQNKTYKRKNNFKKDPSLKKYSFSPNEYSKSGYDKGHIVPAADMNWSKEALEESFYMTNISPQVPEFNRGIWKKLEMKVRAWAIKNDSIYVITGCIIDNKCEKIKNIIPIPEYYYKVVYDISFPTYKSIAFILKNENSNKDIFVYSITVDSLEKITNTDFFHNVKACNIESIESLIEINEWK